MFSEERHHFLTPVQAACLHKTLCYYTAVSKPIVTKNMESRVSVFSFSLYI